MVFIPREQELAARRRAARQAVGRRHSRFERARLVLLEQRSCFLGPPKRRAAVVRREHVSTRFWRNGWAAQSISNDALFYLAAHKSRRTVGTQRVATTERAPLLRRVVAKAHKTQLGRR